MSEFTVDRDDLDIMMVENDWALKEKFKDKIMESLKLQELVKERMGTHKSGHKKLCDEVGYLEQELQSLVEESERTSSNIIKSPRGSEK